MFLTGAWIFWQRHKDPWLLAGVAAVVSRIWIYHRNYDDLIMIIALIALWRLAARGDTLSRLLTGLTAFTLLVSPTFSALPEGAAFFLSWLQTAVWLAALLFLLAHTHAAPANFEGAAHATGVRHDERAKG